MIPEKQAPLGVRGVALACKHDPELEGVFFGDGPDRGAVLSQIEASGIPDRIAAPGFVESERVDHALREATCMLLPSRREGYGMIVVEASACGTPSIVIAGEDNAATELIADGVNGVIIAEPDPEAIAGAIERVKAAGMAMRLSTAQWFTENASRLSLESSLSRVLEAYVWPEG
jgi:glycosyltransferase involved in cell wall biosynthesis